MFLKNTFHASKGLKCISTCVEQTFPMPARTQHVFTKNIRCKRRHKMYLNMCSPKTSHSTEDRKCISTCLYQTLPIPARKQNECQPHLCQRRNKMYLNICDQTTPIPARTENYLNMCLPNTLHASEATKFISTSVVQCQRGKKMHL